ISASGNLSFKNFDEISRELDGYEAAGARWLRFNFFWAQIQHCGPTEYDWAPYDHIVKEATARGLRILGIIAYAPPWANPLAVSGDPYPPLVAADYGRFARATAQRYAPLGVRHWEIWNEPNTAEFWRPMPNVEEYFQLLKEGYQAIKGVDPDATVMIGGLTRAADDSMNISPVTFLRRLYELGAAPFFDAVGWHPYSAPGGPTEETLYGNAWRELSEARKVMEKSGDGGTKIWLTEYGFATGGADGSPWKVSEERQASLLKEAYGLAGTYSWAGPLFWYTYRDAGGDPNDAQNFFGIVRNDFSPKPAFFTYQSIAGGAGR
ncbi:MAG: cellulase family glycosylhydrolase, partial [Actinomycetota bacterium]|nr:cellulase family glycosylhydrolase [Actinomycetota bacterium]